MGRYYARAEGLPDASPTRSATTTSRSGRATSADRAGDGRGGLADKLDSSRLLR